MRLTILVFHITAGILGILSGAVAVVLLKGSRRHRVAGNVFVISMLNMSASAAYLAFMKSQTSNVFGGILTFYLVATAWLTARRGDRAGQTGIFDFAVLLLALAVGAGQILFGLEAALSQTGLKDGYPPVLYFIWAFVALMAAAGDVRMLVRGGIVGAPRIARHVWRMCLALFMATASFFLGQQKVFPAFLRGSTILFAPPVLVLILMIFWLVRVLFTSAYRRTVPI